MKEMTLNEWIQVMDRLASAKDHIQDGRIVRRQYLEPRIVLHHEMMAPTNQMNIGLYVVLLQPVNSYPVGMELDKYPDNVRYVGDDSVEYTARLYLLTRGTTHQILTDVAEPNITMIRPLNAQPHQAWEQWGDRLVHAPQTLQEFLDQMFI